MENWALRASLNILLILMLLPYAFSADIQSGDEASVMVGYSKSYMFPLLDGGTLYFEDGEELWVMTVEKPALLKLISPTGEETEYFLEPLRQTLIKKFGENDEEGQWILKTGTSNLIIQFSGRKILDDNTRLNYKMDIDKLIIEIADQEQEAFIINVKDGGLLVPAGIEVSINLSEFETTNEQSYSTVIMDLVYPRKFIYYGKLAGRPYSITMESLAARIVGKLEGNTLTLLIPDLHKVGAGGTVPVREGEAILKIRYVSTESINRSSGIVNFTYRTEQLKIYVVDDTFNEWVGEKATKKLSIDVEEALNKTLNIIASSIRGVRMYYALIPLTSIVFYEPRLGKTIGNLSLIVEGHQVAVKNDKAYILLANSESALAIPISESGATLIVHASVNGFKAYSGRIQVNRGETYSIPVNLHNLEIKVLFPNGSLVKSGALKINGSRMDFVNGSASYLLPTGSYLVEFSLDEWSGRALVHLHGDASIRIDLARHLRMLDILKIVAGLESIILVSTFILMVRLRRTKYKNTSNNLDRLISILNDEGIVSNLDFYIV